MHSKLLLLIIAALLTGCGHKGPLYLPGQKPAPAANTIPTDATPNQATPTHVPITQP